MKKNSALVAIMCLLCPVGALQPVFRNVTFKDMSVRPSTTEAMQKLPGFPQKSERPSRNQTFGTNSTLIELIEKGKLMTPLLEGMQLSNSSRYHNTNAIQILLQAMNQGVSVAKQVLQSICSNINLNVAPLVFENLASTGALMQVSSPFVLMNIGYRSVSSRMGYVFVPSALARVLLTNPLNKIVWTDANGNEGHIPTATEEAELLNRLWAQVPHDVYITVNTEIDFALGDSDCALVSSSDGYFSVISTLIHELLHGAGIYSLLERDRSGALQGHASIFDALLKSTQFSCTGLELSAGCYLLDQQNLHHLTGEGVAGQTLYLSSSKVYNPQQFVEGSSLSHLDSQDSIMSSTISHSTCRFQLNEYDFAALHELGWTQCNSSAVPHTWNIEDTLLPKSLLTHLSDHTYNLTTQDDTASTSTTTVHSHNCHSHGLTSHCHSDPDAWSTAAAVLFFVAVFVGIGTGIYFCSKEKKCCETPKKDEKDSKDTREKISYEQVPETPPPYAPNAPASSFQVAKLFEHRPSAFVIE